MTLIKLGYSFKQKIKQQATIPKNDHSISLPQNQQFLREKKLSGNAFIIYK